MFASELADAAQVRSEYNQSDFSMGFRERRRYSRPGCEDGSGNIGYKSDSSGRLKEL
jgi:hypothetical protein